MKGKEGKGRKKRKDKKNMKMKITSQNTVHTFLPELVLIYIFSDCFTFGSLLYFFIYVSSWPSCPFPFGGGDWCDLECLEESRSSGFRNQPHPSLAMWSKFLGSGPHLRRRSYPLPYLSLEGIVGAKRGKICKTVASSGARCIFGELLRHLRKLIYIEKHLHLEWPFSCTTLSSF